MFEAILHLKQRVSSDNLLEVTHSSYTWISKFEWYPSIPSSNIEKKLGKPLPKDYVSFMEEISNGGVLFYDANYGQWGFKLYNDNELVEKQDFWKKILGEKWSANYVAFAEIYGEAHVLVFDINKPTKDKDSFAIIEVNPMDPPEYWLKVSRSFHEWLDHLVTAQGAKYWEWQ